MKKNIVLWAMMGLGIYTLLPFLLISQYNQPSADDFYFAVDNTGNDLWAIQKDVYINWSGRFFSTFLSRINPMLLHSFTLYKIYSIVLLILFAITLTLLVREYLKSHASLKQILMISALLIFLYFVQMPSTAEGFYWFSGYCAYQAANILTMILLIVIQKISPFSLSFKSFLLLVFSAALCVAIIGSNEISLIIVCCLILLICLCNKLKSKKLPVNFLFLAAVCFIASAIAVIAPGNFERMKNVQEFSRSPAWTIIGAVSLATGYFIKWSLPLVIASLIYIPLFGIPLAKKIKPGGNFFLVNLKLSIILYFLLFLLLELFFVWVAGGSNLGRVENVIYLYFLLGWFFNLNVIIVKYWKKEDILFTPLRNIIYGFICLLFFLNIFDINNNISTAYIDLISGKAKKYENELLARQKFIKLSKNDTCLVKPLTEIPKTIFFTDIMSIADTAEFWNNRGYSKYFGKSFVITEAKTPPVKSNVQTLEELGKQVRRKIFNVKKR